MLLNNIDYSRISSFLRKLKSFSDYELLSAYVAEHLANELHILSYSVYVFTEPAETPNLYLRGQDKLFDELASFSELYEISKGDDNTITVRNLQNSKTINVDAELFCNLSNLTEKDSSISSSIFPGWNCYYLPMSNGNSAVVNFFTNRLNDRLEHIELLKSVCNEIAFTAITRMVNQELAQREYEKSILISLSNEIASLQTRRDLFKVVNVKLKEIFSITQFGIGQINEDGLSHSSFAMDVSLPEPSLSVFKKATNVSYEIKNDKAFAMVMSSDDLVEIDLALLAKEKNAPAYMKLYAEIGLDKIICLALRTGGRDVGAIFYKKEAIPLTVSQVYLFKAICAQLSVAISNILANEKIQRQLEEINQYKQRLENENTYLQEELQTTNSSSEFIGSSIEMAKVSRLINIVAASGSTVLILGETGTGKELVARAIHNQSSRKDKLMVKVNCAALPASLIESELFGHERGSFTGAVDRRIGKFELANGGTLFLDEVGEMPLELQAKLLRVLQEKEIERIGGKSTIKVDVRIIAATNRDLEKEMTKGNFRSDLYYRLNIFPISLPPLRARINDIPALTDYFVRKIGRKVGKNIHSVTQHVMTELKAYSWPGNIRELEHLLERSILLENTDVIRQIHLPSHSPKNENDQKTTQLKLVTIEENERQYIYDVLEHCDGKITGHGGASEILGIPPSTLRSRMARLGIVRTHVKTT